MAISSFLSGLTVGASLAHFLDPQTGGERRRRAVARLTDSRRAARPTRYGSRAGDLAGLERASLPAAAAPPGSAALLALSGGVLAFYGFTRRGAVAALARGVGAGLLARAWRQPVEPPAAERRRIVDIQKSIHIDAPVAAVYAFWDSYESFPLFLSTVRAVEDLGGGRSRWVVSGPGGRPIVWEAVLTGRQPGRLLAWHSVPGAMLENAGVIRFTPERGGTRVDLRCCYQAPNGGGGAAVTDLLGADPRARLNEDLARLKAVLEASARSEAHGQEPRS
jgi:uncharacterized membrane protein